MLVTDMVKILRPYGIYLHPNGVIKIEGDAMSIAYGYMNAPDIGMPEQPQRLQNIAIRDRAWPYINQIKTIKRICEINGITCEPIGTRLKI